MKKIDNLETKSVERGVSVVYSGSGESADAYIQRQALEHKLSGGGKLSKNIIIVTNDNLIRNAAVDAGVVVMASDRMVSEMKAARNGAMGVAKEAMNRPQVRGEGIGFFQYSDGHFMPDKEMFVKLQAEIDEKRRKKAEAEKKTK
mmetsp:Transcript_34894/g.80704  ORF Transcript_34894/g.80704 Transcript_34894/m.80704 type:complete len:145 (+) Transcript_34894:803-1237(+)